MDNSEYAAVPLSSAERRRIRTALNPAEADHFPHDQTSTGAFEGVLDGIPQSATAILRHAADVIDQRGQTRDTPSGERSMEAAVSIFFQITGIVLEESDGWKFMIALKLARMKQGGFNPDDHIDLAAYSALLLECEFQEPAK